MEVTSLTEVTEVTEVTVVATMEATEEQQPPPPPPPQEQDHMEPQQDGAPGEVYDDGRELERQEDITLAGAAQNKGAEGEAEAPQAPVGEEGKGDAVMDGAKGPPTPTGVKRSRDGGEEKDGEKKWAGWPGDNVFRLVVPVQKVGGIIGRKGEFVKKMCEETRSRIKILEGVPGTAERIVSHFSCTSRSQNNDLCSHLSLESHSDNRGIFPN